MNYEQIATQAELITSMINAILNKMEISTEFIFDVACFKNGKISGFSLSIKNGEAVIDTVIEAANCIAIILAEIIFEISYTYDQEFEFLIGGLLTKLISREAISLQNIKDVNALFTSDKKYMNSKNDKLVITPFSVKLVETEKPKPIPAPVPTPVKKVGKYIVVRPKQQPISQDLASNGWKRDGRFLVGKGKGPKKAEHCHVAIEGNDEDLLNFENPRRQKHLVDFGGSKKCNRLFCALHITKKETELIRESVELSDVSDDDFEEVLEYNLWYYSNKKIFGNEVAIGNSQDAIAFILGGSSKAKSLIWDGQPK